MVPSAAETLLTNLAAESKVRHLAMILHANLQVLQKAMMQLCQLDSQAVACDVGSSEQVAVPVCC